MGSTIAGAGVYYYILEEYRVSNELLTEDIYVCRLLAFLALSHPNLWTSLGSTKRCSANRKLRTDNGGLNQGSEKLRIN